ncbi:hypothetical protein GBAR_LOCUS16259, partial [Geodia barretti]
AACLWRRAILASLEFNRVIPPPFARRLGVAVSVAQGLINRLEREGYVRVPMKNKRLGKIVNKDRIRMDGIKKYFEKTRGRAKSQVTVPSHSKTLERNGDEGGKKLADITNGTSTLSISQTCPGRGIVPSPQVTALQADDGESGVRRSPRIVAKRIRSVANQTLEFELSCSQENSLTDDEQGCRKKRRKSSIASRSILV